MRLEVESDIAVVAIVHQLADAIDAVRDRRVDVLIVDSALLGASSDFTLDHFGMRSAGPG